MGDFDLFCSLSGLPISRGDCVRLMLLVQIRESRADKIDITPNHWLVRALPIRARYTGYGSFEDLHPEDQLLYTAWQGDLVEHFVEIAQDPRGTVVESVLVPDIPLKVLVDLIRRDRIRRKRLPSPIGQCRVTIAAVRQEIWAALVNYPYETHRPLMEGCVFDIVDSRNGWHGFSAYLHGTEEIYRAFRTRLASPIQRFVTVQQACNDPTLEPSLDPTPDWAILFRTNDPYLGIPGHLAESFGHWACSPEIAIQSLAELSAVSVAAEWLGLPWRPAEATGRPRGQWEHHARFTRTILHLCETQITRLNEENPDTPVRTLPETLADPLNEEPTNH